LTNVTFGFGHNSGLPSSVIVGPMALIGLPSPTWIEAVLLKV
jgi:hypothetical protein